MTVRQTVATKMSSVAMAALSQIRPRQGTDVLERELRKQCEGTRIREVLEKAQGLIETLDEFLPKLRATTTKRKRDVDGGSEECAYHSDENSEGSADATTELRGSAAAEIPKPQMPPPVQPSPLKRKQSSTTLCTTDYPPSHRDTSDAGSSIGANEECGSDLEDDGIGDACR